MINCAEMPEKREYTMKIELMVQSIKSHPDSNNPKRKEHTAIVDVVELWKADEITTDANPRHQNMKTTVTRGIKESLLGNDGYFRYKNQGITINCSSIDLVNDPSKPIVIELSENPDDQNGVINGGHTYRTILDTCEQLNSEDDLKPETELSNQSVLVRFFSGIEERESIVSIAEGQNSSVAVTKEAFIHMNKGFDDLINKLPPVWEDQIQFKQNEMKEDGTTPFVMDSRDLLGLIWATNSSKFPSNGIEKVMTRSYSSKSSLVTAYEKDPIDFLVTKEKLKNLLFLRDYILCTAEKIYNTNGGRFGGLRISEKFSKNQVAYLYDKVPERTLNRGAFLPLIASFRVFEERGMFDFETMKKAWDDYGYEMILQINKLVDERESITEVGKDSFCWANMASHWFAWLGKNNL